MHTHPLILVALLVPFVAPAHAGVKWSDATFEAALKQAAAEKKPILIDFFATWCGPCHELDKNVFTQDAVAAELSTLIALRVDAESPPGKALVERYHVVGYPTVLLVGPDGKEVDRLFGYMDAQAFLRTVKDFRAGKGTLADLEGRLAAAPTDLALLAKVAHRQAIRGNRTRAELLTDKVVAGDTSDAKGLASATLYSLARYLYLRGAKDYDKAVATFTRIRAKYPKSKYASRSLLGLATAWHKKGDPKKTRALLQGYLAKSPTSSGACNAVAWFCFKQRFDPKFGLATAQKGLKLNPKDAGLLDTYAELLFQQGDRPAAMKAIERAITADPKEPYYKSQKARFGKGG